MDTRKKEEGRKARKGGKENMVSLIHTLALKKINVCRNPYMHMPSSSDCFNRKIERKIWTHRKNYQTFLLGLTFAHFSFQLLLNILRLPPLMRWTFLGHFLMNCDVRDRKLEADLIMSTEVTYFQFKVDSISALE